MGKVLKSFTHGFVGAISRSLDDVVTAFANKSSGDIAFGVPVALDSTKKGIVPFDPSTHTAADFVGITVRTPSKTPDVYGQNVGKYAEDDIVDVLTRGHIVVEIAGDGELGDAVTILAAGGFTTAAADTGDVALGNVRVSAAKDGGLAEVVLTTRNLL